MKIRLGFVSNSSSSSFICNICGKLESGMDACLGDFNMTECSNGHTFCLDHVSKEEIEEMANSENCDYGDTVESKYCPICQFKKLDLSDLKFIIFKLYGDKEEDVLRKLKENYSDYSEIIKDMLKFKVTNAIV